MCFVRYRIQADLLFLKKKWIKASCSFWRKSPECDISAFLSGRDLFIEDGFKGKKRHLEERTPNMNGRSMTRAVWVRYPWISQCYFKLFRDPVQGWLWMKYELIKASNRWSSNCADNEVATVEWEDTFGGRAPYSLCMLSWPYQPDLHVLYFILIQVHVT